MNAWESRLRAEVERLAGGPLDGARLRSVATALQALHQRFVDPERRPTGAPYLSDRMSLAAYLAYFVPASRAQVARVLADVTPPSHGVWKVLDVGSGPGPAISAVAAWALASGARVEAWALEPSAEALATAQRLWDGAAGTLKTQVWRADQPLPAGPFDIVVGAHMLNELSEADRAALVDAAAQMLAPGGRLVWVEPALRHTTRQLLMLRDRWVAAGGTVEAPCLFQGACPALEQSRDWCHLDRPWDCPDIVSQVSDAAGLERQSLKMAAVVLSRGARAVSVESGSDGRSGRFRVVSQPAPERGKKRVFGCGPSGRHALVRLDKQASDTNSIFDTLERGDVVQIDGLSAAGDGLRIGAESQVHDIDSARTRDDLAATTLTGMAGGSSHV